MPRGPGAAVCPTPRFSSGGVAGAPRRGGDFAYSPRMVKPKLAFTCDSCGAQQPKWQGQCPDCGAWNTLTETRVVRAGRSERAQYTGQVELTRLDRVDVASVRRHSTGLGELDRVLGGGLVPGGVVLLGGDPGIGKSTLLLRALANIAPHAPACYVTGGWV